MCLKVGGIGWRSSNADWFLFLVLILVGNFSTTQSSFHVSSWMFDFYCLGSVDKGRCKEELKLNANPLVSYREFNPLSYEGGMFCEVDGDKFLKQRLGDALTGSRLQSIPYNFKFNTDVSCQRACSVVVADEKRLTALKDIITKVYTQRWYGDGVPVSYCHKLSPDFKNNSRSGNCDSYFVVGCGMSGIGDEQNSTDQNSDDYIGTCVYDIKDANRFIVFNHLIFTVTYREEMVGDKKYAQIIYIDVDLTSAQDMCGDNHNFVSFDVDVKRVKTPFQINYSYTVKFVKDNSLSSTNRLDYLFYGNLNSLKKQWFSFSIVIAIFLIFSVVLGFNFYNLLRKDILRYTQLIDNAQLDIQDEYGWKLLQGDVFRPPKFPLILATTVGFGVQLISMVMTSLLLAAVGLISDHSNRALMTCVVVFYVLFGVLSGYVSARLYKFFGGVHWKRCVFGTSVIHPLLLFSMIFGVNFWLWIYGSPSAIRIGYLFALFFLWLLVSSPLSFLGSYVGFRHRVIQSPVKINHIPRFIPSQSFTIHRIPCIVFGGLPPFVCLYWQLYFLIKSVWVRLHYAMFGFLFVAALIAVIVCAEVVVLLGYLHLSSEDYRWQWRSFFTAASTAFYCFFVVIYYYVNSHVTGSLGAYAYFTYSLVVLYMLAIALGSVGFLSCFVVFLRMYSSIKVD